MSSGMSNFEPYSSKSKVDTSISSLGTPTGLSEPILPKGMYHLPNPLYILATQSSVTRARTNDLWRVQGEYTPTHVGGDTPLSSFSNVPCTVPMCPSHENCAQGAEKYLGLSLQIPGQENVPLSSFHDDSHVHYPYGFATQHTWANANDCSAALNPPCFGWRNARSVL